MNELHEIRKSEGYKHKSVGTKSGTYTLKPHRKR